MFKKAMYLFSTGLTKYIQGPSRSPPLAINGFGRIGKCVLLMSPVKNVNKHLVAGARKVIICGPSKDAPMFVRGVNFDKYKKDMKVLSTTSSTTDCVATFLKNINQEYGVQHCLLTNLYTTTVSKLRYTIDNKVHKITGENKEVGTVIPELKGKVINDSTIVPIPFLDHVKMGLISAHLGSFFRTVPQEFYVSMLRLNITVKKRVKLEQFQYPKPWKSSYSDYSSLLNQVSVKSAKNVTIDKLGTSENLLDMYKDMVKCTTPSWQPGRKCVRTALQRNMNVSLITRGLSIKYETESDKVISGPSKDASPPLEINGFGRIGKCVLLMALAKHVNVVAINDPYVKIEDIAHSLNQEKKMYGIKANISVMRDCNLDIDGHIVRVYTEEDPEKIKWKELQVEYVIESSGKFTEIETAKKHLVAGARKVIICGPSKDAPMFVRGVNFDKYKKDMTVVSTTSSTTDCVATFLKNINQEYGVQHCLLTNLYTTTISKLWYTIDNKVHKITGENKEVGTVIPELKGKVTNDSTIVPIPFLEHVIAGLLGLAYLCYFFRTVVPAFRFSTLRLNITVKKRVKLEQFQYPKPWKSSYSDYSSLLNQVSVKSAKNVTIDKLGTSENLLDMYKDMVKVDLE